MSGEIYVRWEGVKGPVTDKGFEQCFSFFNQDLSSKSFSYMRLF